MRGPRKHGFLLDEMDPSFIVFLAPQTEVRHDLTLNASLPGVFTLYKDNDSTSACEPLGRAFVVFGLLAGVEEGQFFGTVLMETPTRIIFISLGRYRRRGNMLFLLSVAGGAPPLLMTTLDEITDRNLRCLKKGSCFVIKPSSLD
ncbi:hypothetical protein YC2023_007830 [Brassica napus]